MTRNDLEAVSKSAQEYIDNVVLLALKAMLETAERRHFESVGLMRELIAEVRGLRSDLVARQP